MTDLYLSYSGRKCYLTCPLKYYFRYILQEYVMGDPRTSMFGSAIGKIFEWFYSRQLWSQPDPVVSCLSLIEEAIQTTFLREKFDGGLDPAYCESLRQDTNKFIPEGVEVIRSQAFLTQGSRAEVNLQSDYHSVKHGLTLRIGGKADFIHYKAPGEVWIIDGKASKHREKYVDSEQLVWYAAQHYIKYHIAPTRIGFVFWCFPEDPVKWVAYDNNSVRASIDQTFDVAKKIRLKKFDATPSGECHRCEYREKCDSGKKHLAKRRVETGGRIETSIFDLEHLT